MKKAISILLFALFIFFSCKQTENKEKIIIENRTSINQDNQNSINDFLGDWEMESKSKINDDTFSINIIKSTDGKLKGYYCAVARNGNKIDCTPDKEVNITEIKKESNHYLVSFKSFFGATNGEAKIILSNGRLHWQVTKKPIGEFYCPLDAYLTKKNISHSINSKSVGKTIDLSDKNYKGKDITMQLYKDIIEEYGCGDNSVTGKDLGEFNVYEVFIVENNCGDFPFKNIISIKDGKIIDKLLIGSSSFDIEKSETENIKDQTDYTFNIINFTDIQVKEIHTVNNKIEYTKTSSYSLNTNGKFEKKMMIK